MISIYINSNVRVFTFIYSTHPPNHTHSHIPTPLTPTHTHTDNMSSAWQQKTLGGTQTHVRTWDWLGLLFYMMVGSSGLFGDLIDLGTII